MTSARRLYRLLLALGGVGGLALAAAVVAVASAIALRVPSGHELTAACRAAGFGGATPGAIAVLALGALAAATAIRAGAAIVREARLTRHVRDGLRVVDRLRRDGVEVLVVDEALPVAFCAGYLRPRIYVSEGALVALAEDELAAVLAHEAHHAGRRDPLRLLVARVLAEALFVLPVIGRLRDHYAALAEVAADEAAVRAVGDPAPLASALLSLGETGHPGVVAVAPERVEHLAGGRSTRRLRPPLLAGTAAAIAVLAALPAAIARLAPGEVTVAALLAQGCMLAMVIAPIALAAAFLLTGGRLLRTAYRARAGAR